MKKQLIAGLAGGLLMISLAGSANAMALIPTWPIDPSVNLADIHLSYDVTPGIGGFSSNIYQAITFNSYAAGDTGCWWASSVDVAGGAINDPFAKSSTNMPLTGLIMGLMDDSSSNPHLVMMVDSGAATSYAGQAFEASFPNTNEAVLTSQLNLVTGTDRNTLDADGQAAWDAALNNLFSFAQNDGLSARFALGNLPYPSAPGTIVTSNFAVVQWSDGQQIGTGVANLQYSPVPVPSTMLLIGSGLTGLLALRKRSQRA